ncbi:hypothetical protein Ae331Ps2_4464c [Pseudonocardia sp. Ae331_Ps2]|nr:hypothetical protein Ae331Ps2_4464c [Pseudonocardia sp. Ae331_Ps2]
MPVGSWWASSSHLRGAGPDIVVDVDPDGSRHQFRGPRLTIRGPGATSGSSV